MCYLIVYILVFFILLSGIFMLFYGFYEPSLVYKVAGASVTYAGWWLFRKIPKNK